MRFIYLLPILIVSLGAEVNEIFNQGVNTQEYFHKSDRYEAYFDRDTKKLSLIKDRHNPRSFPKMDSDDYFKVDIYEDNNAYMIPSGLFTIKSKTTPEDYKSKRQIQEMFGFERCETYNREFYKCYTYDITKQEKLIMGKVGVEKTQRVEIGIDYIYVFK